MWTCGFWQPFHTKTHFMRVQGLEISRKMRPKTLLEWVIFLLDFWISFCPVLGAILEHFGSQNPPKMWSKSYMSKMTISMWPCGLHGWWPSFGNLEFWVAVYHRIPPSSRGFLLTIAYCPWVSVTNGPIGYRSFIGHSHRPWIQHARRQEGRRILCEVKCCCSCCGGRAAWMCLVFAPSLIMLCATAAWAPHHCGWWFTYIACVRSNVVAAAVVSGLGVLVFAPSYQCRCFAVQLEGPSSCPSLCWP